jgi:drug/metabolite transporter (DMT)-like permease
MAAKPQPNGKAAVLQAALWKHSRIDFHQRAQGRATMTKHIGILAAVFATLLWSLKPIYVSLLKDDMEPSEIFFCAGLISLLASALGFVILWRDLLKLWRSGIFKQTLNRCLIAGSLLSVWYIAFYKALSGAGSAQATIISFTWPFVAIIAMRIFAPHLQRPLARREYPFLAIAFVGAAVTASGGESSAQLVFFALIAALGSGFYLPFLSLSLESVVEVFDNRLKSSFVVVSLANTFSFIVATPILMTFGVSLVPDAPSLTQLTVVAAIGVGTYIVAELVWCWAICTTRSPTIAALPYFSPAVSVMLLGSFAGASVPSSAIVGLLLILFGNLSLHYEILPRRKRGDTQEA